MSAAPLVPLARARAHVLVKQGLAGEGLGRVMDAVTVTAGIYGTAPTCYLSCAARVRDFRLAALDQELYARRSVVRLRCMRGMAYIEPLDLLPALVACTGEAPDTTMRRVVKYSGLSEPEVRELADRIEAAMAAQPPMTVREIRQALGSELPADGEALQMTVALLGRTGRIVRAEVRGSWRSDNYAYARWTDWLDGPVEPVDPAAARVEVARRCLRAYGPASADDLNWWSGWTKRDTAAALADLGGEIRAVSLDGVAAWVLAGELDGLREVAPEAGQGVRLLPVWDAYFMGYAAAPTSRARPVAADDYGAGLVVGGVVGRDHPAVEGSAQLRDREGGRHEELLHERGPGGRCAGWWKGLERPRHLPAGCRQQRRTAVGAWAPAEVCVAVWSGSPRGLVHRNDDQSSEGVLLCGCHCLVRAAM
jgi:hypothetical protein